MSFDPKDLEFEMSDADPSQIARYTYSEKHNAERVVVVGGQMDIKVEAQFPENMKFPEQMAPQIIEKPIIVKEIEIREIEKPVFIDREKIVEIEKPVVVIQKEIQIQEVIKEVVVVQKELVNVDRPVIVEKDKFIEMPKELKILMLVQSIAMIGLMLINIFKH